MILSIVRLCAGEVARINSLVLLVGPISLFFLLLLYTGRFLCNLDLIYDVKGATIISHEVGAP